MNYSTVVTKPRNASPNELNRMASKDVGLHEAYQPWTKLTIDRANGHDCTMRIHCKTIKHSNSANQKGVVLVVGLIMLSLLTLIGLTSSQVTGLEEKMAGNNRNYNMAFQAAESALRAGEAATATVVAANYYTGSTQSYDFNNAKATPYNGGALAGIPSANAPKFVIEMISTTNIATGTGGSLEAGTASGSTGTANWYRVTAQGKGGDANAVVTLQSIYRR